MRIPLKFNAAAGFSFIELVLVITLLSVIVAIATLSYSDLQQDVTADLVRADLKTIQGGLRSYYMDNNSFPGSLDPLATDGYLDALPDDKFVHGSGQTYLYTNNTSSCTVWSRGPDRIDNNGGGDDISLTFGP